MEGEYEMAVQDLVEEYPLAILAATGTGGGAQP